MYTVYYGLCVRSNFKVLCIITCNHVLWIYFNNCVNEWVALCSSRYTLVHSSTRFRVLYRQRVYNSVFKLTLYTLNRLKQSRFQYKLWTEKEEKSRTDIWIVNNNAAWWFYTRSSAYLESLEHCHHILVFNIVTCQIFTWFYL